MPKIEADRESTTYNFLSSTMTLIFVPFFGYLSDRYCWHSNFGVLAPIVTQISFLLYISIYPLIPTIIYSIGFSLNYTAVWSNISLCVSNEHMGIAMGLIYSLQNVALLITPNLTLFIQKKSNSYEDAIVFLMFMNMIALGFAIGYHWEHKKKITSRKSEKLNKKPGFFPEYSQFVEEGEPNKHPKSDVV